MLLAFLCVKAQQSHQAEVWGGLITSYKISEKWGLWNDAHFVPTAFWINRHGLTYRVSPQSRLTAGYAFVLTATSFTDKLVRREHRPWWQYEVVKPLGTQWGYRYRLRYDRRIRQRIAAGEMGDGWVAYNRWRLMLSVRRQLKTFANGRTLHAHLLNEILVNNGQHYTGHWLDQNRTYLMCEYRFEKTRLLFGPHLRAIPNAQNDFNFRYGFTLWVIQPLEGKLWLNP